MAPADIQSQPLQATQLQIMMTLAGLAATAAAERPSGETLEAHRMRIWQGILNQMTAPGIAVSNQWEVVWVGLTANRANLAYLAMHPTSDSAEYALVLRGTMAASPIDTSEDMQVGMLIPFAAGGTPPGGGDLGQISQGAMAAFTDIVMGTDLVQTLQGIEPSVLYVVGHSLGGAMVTTISLYLATFLLPASMIYPYTFAAPTAGDKAFAKWFDTQFPTAQCYYNYYDLIPHAWASLDSLYQDPKKEPFYPDSESSPQGPGPTASLKNDLGYIIKAVASDAPKNTYVQPTQQTPLNAPSAGQPIFLNTYPPGATTDMAQFELQVGFQHANNTYLTLLGAPVLGAPSQPTMTPPAIRSVSPASGSVLGGTSVVITPLPNVFFSPDSVVDFGIVPAVATVAQDGSSITATAPPGIGTVDVRVTSMYGTSPAVPVVPNLTNYDNSDQFTYVAG